MSIFLTILILNKTKFLNVHGSENKYEHNISNNIKIPRLGQFSQLINDKRIETWGIGLFGPGQATRDIYRSVILVQAARNDRQC